MTKKGTSKSIKTLQPPSKKEYNMLRDGITQSLLANFMCCRLRGLLAINRWSHPDKVLNTGFGSMFHDVLDKIYSNGSKPAIDKIKKWLDEFIKENYKKGSAKTKDAAQFDAAQATALFIVYLERYDEDFTKKQFKRVEQIWEAECGEYKLRAKIDGEYLDKKNQPWLIEHKTKSHVRDDFLQKHLSFDFQCLFYTYIYEQNTRKNIRGVLYNIVRKPSHKLHIGETLKAYTERMISVISKEPDNFFHRYEIAFTPADKRRFAEELKLKLIDAENVISGGAVYKNEFACMMPYKCEFLEACACGHLNGYVQKDCVSPELDG
jgi:hypothetical protein